MAKAKWHRQWEGLVIQKLEANNIEYELTGFSIAGNLRSKRNYEWEDFVSSGQIVEVVYPKSKGSKLKLKAQNVDGMPVNIGSVEFYDNEANYVKGIVCQLQTKTLEYKSGEDKECLDYEQSVILVANDSIPNEVLNDNTLRIKEKAKGSGGMCLVVLVILMTCSFILAIHF